VGDVSEMNHQLALTLEDRPLHSSYGEIWIRAGSQKFGGCYCPFCAQYVWQKRANDHKTEYPLTAKAVKNGCYMDALLPSVETVETAKEMRHQLAELGDKGGFHIRKWIS